MKPAVIKPKGWQSSGRKQKGELWSSPVFFGMRFLETGLKRQSLNHFQLSFNAEQQSQSHGQKIIGSVDIKADTDILIAEKL